MSEEIKSICYICKHFNSEVFEEKKKEFGDILAGAKACLSNGVASEGKIWCSCFERRENEVKA